MKPTATQRTFALTLATVALSLALSPASASAQAPSLKPNFYLGGGVAALTNPSELEVLYSGKYSLLAAVGLPFSIGIEVMAKIQYHSFGLSTFLKDRGVPDPNMNIITYGLDAKWSLLPAPIPARPYLLVGLGRYHWQQGAVSGGSVTLFRVKESDMYFNIGVGLDVSLGAFALFVEIKHTILNLPGESIGIAPIVVGVRVI